MSSSFKDKKAAQAAGHTQPEAVTLNSDNIYVPVVDQSLIGFLRAGADVYNNGDEAASTEPSDSLSDDDALDAESESLASFNADAERQKLEDEKDVLSDGEVEFRGNDIAQRDERFKEKEVKRKPAREVLIGMIGFTEEFARHAAAELTKHPRHFRKMKETKIRTHKRFDVADLKLTKNRKSVMKGEDWNWGQLREFVRNITRAEKHKPKEKPKQFLTSEKLEMEMLREVNANAAKVANQGSSDSSDMEKDTKKWHDPRHDAKQLAAGRDRIKKEQRKLLERKLRDESSSAHEEALMRKFEEKKEFSRLLAQDGLDMLDLTPEQKVDYERRAMETVREAFLERATEGAGGGLRGALEERLQAKMAGNDNKGAATGAASSSGRSSAVEQMAARASTKAKNKSLFAK
ncbi:unnamed protein product [Amoebophrya sp. A25]|nr:unnamed protein product [Amoebophrya sp. A25]|eukprot:GSA25T00024589001.1